MLLMTEDSYSLNLLCCACDLHVAFICGAIFHCTFNGESQHASARPHQQVLKYGES